MKTAYITHNACLKHDMGFGHPETPARLHAIEDRLIASGLMPLLDHHEARPATRDDLALAHTQAYIDSIFDLSPQHGAIYLDDDTVMNPHSLNAALYAAGAAVQAVDLVMSGACANAFCNIRPPGHHAFADRSAGFCIFNNVAIAALHALLNHGLQRVAIVDFDVHHGDGTEAIFRDDPRVLMCSTFRHPFYPFSGADSGSAHIINVPLSAGTDGERFRQAVEQRWLPVLEGFQPQFVLISAGFDAHREDDMGGLALREADYAWVTEQIMTVAARHASGRVVSVLEGGYALSALGRSASAHIKTLAGL